MTLLEDLAKHYDQENQEVSAFITEVGKLEERLKSLKVRLGKQGESMQVVDRAGNIFVRDLVEYTATYIYGNKLNDPQVPPDVEQKGVGKRVVDGLMYFIVVAAKKPSYFAWVNYVLTDLPFLALSLSEDYIKNWIDIGTGTQKKEEVLGQQAVDVPAITPETYFNLTSNKNPGYIVFEILQDLQEKEQLGLAGEVSLDSGDLIQGAVPMNIKEVFADQEDSGDSGGPFPPAVDKVGRRGFSSPSPWQTEQPPYMEDSSAAPRKKSPAGASAVVDPVAKTAVTSLPGATTRGVSPPTPPPGTASPIHAGAKGTPAPATSPLRVSPLEEQFYNRMVSALGTQANLPKVQGDLKKYSAGIVEHLVPFRGSNVLKDIESTYAFLKGKDREFVMPFLSSAARLYDALPPKYVTAFVEQGLNVELWKKYQQQERQKAPASSPGQKGSQQVPPSTPKISYMDATQAVVDFLGLRTPESTTALSQLRLKQEQESRHSRRLGWGLAYAATAAAVLSAGLWMGAPSYQNHQLKSKLAKQQRELDLRFTQLDGLTQELSEMKGALPTSGAMYGTRLRQTIKNDPNDKSIFDLVEQYLSSHPEQEIVVRARDCANAFSNLHWAMTQGLFPETKEPFLNALKGSSYCTPTDDTKLREATQETYRKLEPQNGGSKGE